MYLLQTLVPGAPASRLFVDTNKTQHFRIDVTDITQDLIITVNPLYGDPDVYVSSTSTNPGCVLGVPILNIPMATCFNYTWSSTLSQMDVVQIDHNAPCSSNAVPACATSDWKVGTFYVGVFGLEAALYDITVQVQGPNALVPGLTQTGTTSGDQFAYFSLQVPYLAVRMVGNDRSSARLFSFCYTLWSLYLSPTHCLLPALCLLVSVFLCLAFCLCVWLAHLALPHLQ